MMKPSTRKRGKTVKTRWERRLRWGWLYPGVRLKRWLFLLLLSLVVLGVGVSGMMGHVFRDFEVRVIDYKPLARQIQSLRFIDFLLLVLGIAGAVLAFRRGLYSVLTVLMPARENEYATVALKRLRLKRGPKLVAIGGGTGLPALLSGLKEYSANITAIVTMADDGGSSGRLRREYQALPPGDLRNCLVAMAETSPLMSQLFQHRFKGQGTGIEGHSFGNLFITALGEVTGDFASGVKAASQVLAVSGQVLPVTVDPVVLEAELQDGTMLTGESRISKSKQPIKKIRLLPPNVKPAPETREAIAEADAIVMGPGSLYTSILSNLLVPGIADEIVASRAVKIFVCNVMTQPGETDGMSLLDHVQAVRQHTRPDLIQYVLANTQAPSQGILHKYREMNAHPVLPQFTDSTMLDEWGVTLIRSRLAIEDDYFRHDPQRLAQVVLKLIVI
ncbi:YvcK family protein [candidate division FCPU426 bacterium]|nr:YvcK family protein [candidate division FCPU426 bacterium]